MMRQRLSDYRDSVLMGLQRMAIVLNFILIFIVATHIGKQDNRHKMIIYLTAGLCVLIPTKTADLLQPHVEGALIT